MCEITGAGTGLGEVNEEDRRADVAAVSRFRVDHGLDHIIDVHTHFMPTRVMDKVSSSTAAPARQRADSPGRTGSRRRWPGSRACR